MNPFVLLSFLFFFGACTGIKKNSIPKPPELRVVNYDTALHNTNDSWIYKGKSFSGYMIEIEKDGHTVYELPIINGKENGMARGWYSSGEKLLDRYFIDGKKEGEFIQWWPNSNFRYVFYYSNDLFDGVQTAFFPNGKKREESFYRSGNKEGKQIVWNEEGRVVSNYTIRNKKMYGVISVKSCLPIIH